MLGAEQSSSSCVPWRWWGCRDDLHVPVCPPGMQKTGLPLPPSSENQQGMTQRLSLHGMEQIGPSHMISSACGRAAAGSWELCYITQAGTAAAIS